MDTWLLSNESQLRLGFFLGMLILMASLEGFLPRRRINNNDFGKSPFRRWFNNLSLITLSSLVVKILLPLSLVNFAILCQKSGWGLLNQGELSELLPVVPSIILSLFLFDLIIYWQHRVFHQVPWLWKLHQVHHSDIAIDVTTGIRFHPIEILFSVGIKFAAIFLFGFSAVSIILFEILLNALALFNHSNVRIPLALDKVIRLFIVTPDMHRVHHSCRPDEHNRNFGFNISVWDRIFGSYQNQPNLGHDDMIIGLNKFATSDQPNRLSKLLLMPFKPAEK